MENNTVSKFRPILPDYFKRYVDRLRLFNEEDLEILFDKNHISAREMANEDDIPFNAVSHYWIKTPKLSTFVKIDKSKPDFTKTWIRECLEQITIEPSKINNVNIVNTGRVLRLVLTDIHIGMETDAHGFGLYGGVWNEEELEKRRIEILTKAKKLFLQNQMSQFEEIHVIDLGDYMDGWDSMTTRKGHALPQNMDNRKAFQIGVKFKVSLYEDLQNIFSVPLKAFNVINDNHSADFGYIVNESVKSLSEIRNEHIKVFNLERFMQHYFIGEHCFILSHGKDQQHMRFGLKPQLDAASKDKIEEYIRFHNLSQKAKSITFEKGDSHQKILDYSTGDTFNYFNYLAFSPSSDWVQTNCKRGKSGFTFMIVDQEESEHVLHPFTFKWQTKPEEKELIY